MKTPLLILGALLVPTAAYAGNEDASPHPPFPGPRHSGEGKIAFTSSNVALLSWKSLADFPGGNTSGNDCWGYTSGSGREYAIIGLSNGTGFVEVTDPGAAEIVAFKTGVSSLWRCIKVHGAYAYAGSEAGGGIQVFDMTNIDSGVVTTLASVTTGGCTTATHTLAVDNTSGYLYRAGGSGTPCGGLPQGLVIYSLANPAAPSFVGDWSIGRYVHECQVVTWDIAGPNFGKQIAFCFTETSSGGGDPRMTILDVTNKASITQLSSITYTGGQFSHQGWITADKQNLYLNDELDDGSFGGARTRVFNIANLSAPSYITFFPAGAPSIDHNLYVVGNTIYEGNYRSGLRIFDNSSSVTAPSLVGFFDTYPEDNAQEFNSLWSNYPFFASGTIIGGDIEKGLFVWRRGARLLSFDYPSGVPQFIAPSGGVVQFTVDENTAGDLQAGTVEFHFSTGAAFTTVSASHVSGNLYQASIPPLDCGDQVEFYVSAKSIDDVTWTDPEAAPTQVHIATAAISEELMQEDTMETATAWLVNQAADLTGFTTASTGTWIRANPVGTSAQPEDDHTSVGTFAWVTANGSAGGAVGDADVDGGATSLRSPLFTAAGMNDPHVVYWRWYSNSAGSAPGEDVFTVDISNNNGSNWVNLETVGPTGADVLGGWIQHRARIADFVTPTANMRLRFRTSDLNSGSIVEAAVDDFQVIDLDCEANVFITSLSSSSGNIRGGETILVNGDGFVPGLTGVLFGSVAGNHVQVLSPTQLAVNVPNAGGPSSGKLMRMDTVVDVTVTLGAATATLPHAYTYVLPTRTH